MHRSYAWKASALIGERVHNSADENLGKIEDLIIDPESGAIMYAVLSFGDFPGLGGELFAAPWTALDMSAKGDLLLDIDKETLKRAPTFDRNNWPDTADPAWQRRVRDYYGQPYVRPERDRSVYTERVVPRDVVHPRRETPLAAAVLLVLLLIGALWVTFLVATRGWDAAMNDIQNSARGVVYAMKEGSEDAALTTKVKTALSLSKRIPAGNINVDSQDGVVTLRGEVSSPEIRELAETIARDTPGVSEVRNHLFSLSQTQ